jgi:caa(3)-type oxidase subunit IV
VPAQSVSVWRHIVVLVALVLLTLVNVGLSFADVSHDWHPTFGVTIAVLNASLVALFFMHLIRSPRTTWAVVIVSVFWLVVVLMALTFSDYSTRSAFPFTPGH